MKTRTGFLIRLGTTVPAILMITAWLLAMPRQASAESEASREAGIKAAYLFNFVPFIEWPATAFTDESAPMTIDIIGDSPVKPKLEEIAKGKSVKKRPLAVKWCKDISDMTKCQMLFIGRTEKVRIHEILSAVAGSPVLTVGETEGFTEQGGAISFYRDGAKVRFEINLQAVRTSGLSINSQLLSLARLKETKESAK
jgi:hypothetical protein